MKTINNGWVCLHRSILSWEWWDDLPTRNLFFYCLLSANHKDEIWHGIQIPRGSFATSYDALSKGTGFSVKQMRRAVLNLKNTGELGTQRVGNWAILTVSNYDRYQDVANVQGQTKGKKKADLGQTLGIERATNNNNNNITSKEDNNIKKYSPKGEYKEIADLWHSICTSLPKVRMITDARRAKIKTRLSEFGDDPMATLRTIFEKIQASDFCKGGNDRHWQADFDWVFENDTNWVKVVEGKYDNMQPQKVPIPPGVKLGVGEYITPDGRRTYGIGRANVPLDAPPRGYDDLIWDSGSKRWVPYV